MVTVALPLVLVSAVTHALWNAAIKRLADPEAAAVAVVAGAGLSSGVAALIAGSGFPPASVPWVFASGIVEAIYFVTLTRTLTRLPLGTAYGITRGGGQLVTWPVSMLWWGEKAGPTALVGAMLLVVGLMGRVRRPLPLSALAWALPCAVAIGAYPLTYQGALAHGAPNTLLFSASLAISLPVQILALGSARGARLAALRPHLPLLSMSAIACAASFLLFLAALGLGGAGHMSAIRNTSIAFATVLGALSGDAMDRRAWWSAAAITLGAVLVSAA